jgi:hypothetical protein
MSGKPVLNIFMMCDRMPKFRSQFLSICIFNKCPLDVAEEIMLPTSINNAVDEPMRFVCASDMNRPVRTRTPGGVGGKG